MKSKNGKIEIKMFLQYALIKLNKLINNSSSGIATILKKITTTTTTIEGNLTVYTIYDENAFNVKCHVVNSLDTIVVVP